jgi:predicted GNAT superfamily acetyltransferase
MSLFTPEALGFAPLLDAVTDEGEQLAWTKTLRGGPIAFRLLRTLEELDPAESMQRDVFGCEDLDIASAGLLMTVHDTGGDVIGAVRTVDGAEETIGLSIGWGGYFARKPVFISDILAVREAARYAGIGVEIKKLQAALAAARGFNEVTWTVDPLRAPNARLNFEKLGAVSNRYEQNRYGESYGTALYGGLPSDRLHISWRLDEPTLLDRLNGKIPARTTADLLGALAFDPLVPTVDRAFVLIPADFDALLKADYDAALTWRMELRRLLPAAFDAGLAVTGFVANADEAQNAAALLLTRTS